MTSTFSSQAFYEGIDAELEEITAQGLRKNERILASPQAREIRVGNRTVLNFCANNYLGLAASPALRSAAKAAIDEFGLGLASVRFICGTQSLHKDLERGLAEFFGMEDCILYPSCFDANGGLFETLLGENDAVLSDSLNHASIIDGIRLCKAKRFRFVHNDMSDLRAQLEKARTEGVRRALITSDGVFSMDGDIAKLPELVALAKEYGALLHIDECHATGVLGKHGRGTAEHFGLEGQVDIITSTLGKALGGSAGGFTLARRSVVDLLRQRSRPYLFSNTLAPAIAGASLECLKVLRSDTSLLDTLRENTAYFRSRITAAGFQVRGDNHPIVPVMLGDARLAAELADDLLAEGIYVIGFSYPVVPKGEARIRVQVSAGHTKADLDHAITSFAKVGKKRGVIAG